MLFPIKETTMADDTNDILNAILERLTSLEVAVAAIPVEVADLIADTDSEDDSDDSDEVLEDMDLEFVNEYAPYSNEEITEETDEESVS
jgi:hypothetical protein